LCASKFDEKSNNLKLLELFSLYSSEKKSKLAFKQWRDEHGVVCKKCQGGNTPQITYQYSGNTAVEVDYTPSGTPSNTITYYLNGQGLATSDNLGDSMSYDAFGEQIYANNANGIYTYTWSNGDIISANTYSGGSNTITIYTYHSALQSLNLGRPEFGKSTKHLPYWSNQSYGFDSLGRLSSDTMLTGVGNGKIVTLYSYY
jgi:hypothetical protein